MNILNLLSEESLVPVVTFNEGDDLDGFAHFLFTKQVHCIEITLRTPFAYSALKHFKDQYGDRMRVGAGTVINSTQIKELATINVDFLVSPGLSEKLTNEAKNCNIPILPGVTTPSEVIRALELGIDVLKFFPAALNGGVPVLKAFEQVFPSVQFCPTGGISQATSQEYLALNNVFAVGGSWFQKDFKNK